MEAETVKASAKPKRQRAAWQPPEVINRPATEEETPKPAADLAKLARENGWDVTVTYARGTTDSDSPKLVHSIAVRMQRGVQRAVAVWMSPVEGKASWTRQMGARLGRWSCQKSGMSGPMPVKMSSVDLRAHLATPEQVDNASLPSDVWAAGMDTEMIDGLERLAALFVGGGESA